MVKTLSLAALALVAALVLGFGQTLTTSTPKAHADTTGMSVVACEWIAIALDEITPCSDPQDLTPGDLVDLADVIGDEDGVLEQSDFSGGDPLGAQIDESWDDNQISTDCSIDKLANDDVDEIGNSWTEIDIGLACTLDVFVFTDNESAVTFDAPNGLTFVTTDPASNDWTCDTEAEDSDCANVTPNDTTRDGVVVNGLLIGSPNGAGAGETLTIKVTQQAVEQTADINVVGPPNDVKLTLGEDRIETSGSQSNGNDCLDNTRLEDALDQPNSTLAWSQVTDADDTILTRIPVLLRPSPPESSEIADIAQYEFAGNSQEEISPWTFYTVDPTTAGAPTAAYSTICGMKATGDVTVVAEINLLVPPNFSSYDKSTADLTVGGPPKTLNLTAAASTIKCDGSETSTVTAKVTDSNGDNVADGVPVNFSVVALGTANPINTVTKDGMASTTITPLSNSSAGVTVIVTAEGANGSSVQVAVRVDCALPLATQPTLAPPVVVPTARTGIGGPDTGNGGYLGQNSSSSFPMWTLIALALGSMTLVAGGVVTRRAGK